jgi:hypothetical protein
MKKLITMAMIALCAFGITTSTHAEIDEVTTVFGVSTSVGFESEYNSKGKSVVDNAITTNVHIDMYDAYIGVDGFWTVDAGSENYVEAYAGYTVKDLIVDGIDFDIGTDLNLNLNAAGSDENYSLEPYVGVTFSDLFLTPSLYAHYDISYEQLSLELTLSEEFVATNNAPIFGEVRVTPTVYGGYSHVGDLTPKAANISDGYTYLGGSIALSATVGVFDVSVGPRYVVTDGAEFGSAFNREFDSNRLSWFITAGYNF